jgi:hypothetical protein
VPSDNFYVFVFDVLRKKFLQTDQNIRKRLESSTSIFDEFSQRAKFFADKSFHSAEIDSRELLLVSYTYLHLRASVCVIQKLRTRKIK